MHLKILGTFVQKRRQAQVLQAEVQAVEAEADVAEAPSFIQRANTKALLAKIAPAEQDGGRQAIMALLMG